MRLLRSEWDSGAFFSSPLCPHMPIHVSVTLPGPSTPPATFYPIHLFYLAYLLCAGSLAWFVVHVTYRSRTQFVLDTTWHAHGWLLLLSRAGTLILTAGTFLDNLRTFLAAFPQTQWPASVLANYGNATRAQLAWAADDYAGAGFQVGMFEACDFLHIVLTSVSLFTVGQFALTLPNAQGYTPALVRGDRHDVYLLTGGRWARRVQVISLAAVAAVTIASAVGYALGPVQGHPQLDAKLGVLVLGGSKPSPVLMGLLAVFAYSFGMIAVGIAAVCKEGWSMHGNGYFLAAQIAALALQGASGGATGWRYATHRDERTEMESNGCPYSYC